MPGGENAGMHDFEILPGDRVPAPELHQAFVEAFADYLIGPFQVPLEQWPGFLARQAIDLGLSRVARLDGRVAAFAFVAPRTPTRWRLGTMGAVPAARGSGAAPVLLDDFVRRAQQAGVQIVELEVFAQNERAARLYAGRGFQVVQSLHGYERVAPTEGERPHDATDDVREVPLDEAFAWIEQASSRIDDLPLQVTPPVLAANRAALRALRHGDAQVVYAPGADAAAPVVIHSLIDLDPAQRDADTLLSALVARHPGRTIKVPALQRPDVGGEALDRAGFVRQQLHQHLMRRSAG